MTVERDNLLIAKYMNVGSLYAATSDNRYNRYHLDLNVLLRVVRRLTVDIEDIDYVNLDVSITDSVEVIHERVVQCLKEMRKRGHR